MLIYTPRPDDTTLVEPNMSLKIEDIKFSKPEFITKNGYHYDNSILEQIELPDGTINFEFKSVCIENDYGKFYYNILGQRHRTNAPAVTKPDSTKEYWFNDKLHRTNGPAIIKPDGDKYWYQNGRLHRIDEPAITRSNGTKYWCQNGKRHRLDGPAIIYSDGSEEYWLNGTQVTKPTKNILNES